jgi:hypothetical protein
MLVEFNFLEKYSEMFGQFYFLRFRKMSDLLLPEIENAGGIS